MIRMYYVNRLHSLLPWFVICRTARLRSEALKNLSVINEIRRLSKLSLNVCIHSRSYQGKISRWSLRFNVTLSDAFTYDCVNREKRSHSLIQYTRPTNCLKTNEASWHFELYTSLYITYIMLYNSMYIKYFSLYNIHHVIQLHVYYILYTIQLRKPTLNSLHSLTFLISHNNLFMIHT